MNEAEPWILIEIDDTVDGQELGLRSSRYPRGMALTAGADQVLDELKGSDLSGSALRKLAMQLLSKFAGYDWCGIYRLEGEELILDEYIGEPTDHMVIPVGEGVCGTAVKENRNQVVEDVSALENYLSCSIKTKAEIVVLIRDSDGRVLGQIDIDSHRLGAFDSSDEELLEHLAQILALKW